MIGRWQELALGDQPSAQRDLDAVLGMLNAMIAAGVERSGTYELRAKVYALKGQGDDAMRDLSQAAKLGWRRAWWATHEPYLVRCSRGATFRRSFLRLKESNRSTARRIDTRKDAGT